MPIALQLNNVRQDLEWEHPSGPLEFGRGPRDECERQIVEDLAVSRDQMRIQELPGGRLRIDNLSRRVAVRVEERGEVEPGSTRELSLPVVLGIGATTIRVRGAGIRPRPITLESQGDLLATIAPPVSRSSAEKFRSLLDAEETPDAETLAQWFETVVRVQEAAATSEEFYDRTAKAVVDLVGLDEGLVIVRNEENDRWEIAARHGIEDVAGEPFSRRILEDVVARGRTFYRELDGLSPTASLANVSAAVASPIHGLDGSEVVGVVYGRRGLGASSVAPIRALEAQLVQVLASAVGAGLSRLAKEAEATRWRVQLESFFTPRLVEELDRNPNLLNGDERDVTVLFADIRGFTDCTERLGPAEACRLVGDVMDHLSEIVQRHDGVIVDYYGDGLMAMWNAPITQTDHPRRALEAALQIQRERPGFGTNWEEGTGRPLGIGVGVNTGHAVVGNVGSRQKFKYGALGLTVNLAQRIESITKRVGIPVVCARRTFQEGGAGHEVPLGACRLSGAQKPVELVALPASDEWSAEASEHHEAALAAFRSGEWTRTTTLVAASPALSTHPLGRLLADQSRKLDADDAPAERAVLDLRTK